MKRPILWVAILTSLGVAACVTPASAVSVEETNSCRSTMDDPCARMGSCSIQGADWFQSVQIDRSDIFDTPEGTCP